MKAWIAATVVVLLSLTTNAFGVEPMEALRGPIERGLQIIKDPELQAEDKKDEQRRLLKQEVWSVFNFEEISRRALANNWRLFDEAQRERFVDLFSQLLFETYISKIRSEYQDEAVVFLDQEVTDDRAKVFTKVTRESVETPIDYSMKMIDGHWQVYDVRVENVSLVGNYRSQFSKILLRNSPDHLIESLRKKVQGKSS
ncbi:MAG: ABC transporter substrate-binding protein [Desulfobacteraceae bacterium]|nr:ABC transporter substrate-binding protein [Desulfobacteraceae bacterium]